MSRFDNIHTYTGIRLCPATIRADQISIVDIASSLSMLCRYTGHLKEFYSVAEHSVIVSRFVPEEYAMWGLLHDASEAYTGDFNRPTKYGMPDFLELEDYIMGVVTEKFNICKEMPSEVKDIDIAICANELRDLHLNQNIWKRNCAPPIDGLNICMPLYPKGAKDQFLRRFIELGGRIG